MAQQNVEDRAAARRMLLGLGLEFCDEEHTRLTTEDIRQMQTSQKRTQCLEQLLVEGWEASSTDNAGQGIENTLTDNEQFWSSTGSPEQLSHAAQEFLVYRLKSPLSIVHSIHISIYRAVYQSGEPIYPPGAVSVYAKPLHGQQWSCLAKSVDLKPTEMTQTITLSPATHVIGPFLKIKFHGKRQLQLHDWKTYIAIRLVEARGVVIPLSCFNQLEAGLKASQSFFPSRFFAMASRPYCRLADGTHILEELQDKLRRADENKEMKEEVAVSVPSIHGLVWETEETSGVKCRVYDSR